jgi:hypothetical protein
VLILPVQFRLTGLRPVSYARLMKGPYSLISSNILPYF